MKKIVLVTVGQPSVNPRIVKEADAFAGAGHEVTVIYSYVIKWASDADKVLFQKVKWHYIEAGGSPKNKTALYFYTKLRNRAAMYIGQILKTHKHFIAERIQARAYDELLDTAKKIKADWYIGHNLGALPVAVKAAKFHGAKAGFDFEDYHRGESDERDKTILNRITCLEEKYIPALNYYSTSSKMITDDTQRNFPGFAGSVITLRNCFPLSQQPPFRIKESADHTLHLFWFSQTIGLNRGLEVFIDALKFLKDPAIQLTLAGRCDENMEEYIKTNASEILPQIHFAGIVQPEELPAFAAQFDVGLAIELSEPYNRDICLTNKVFTYLTAGNAIILSQTKMQAAFNDEYKVGESFPVGDVKGLVACIQFYRDAEMLNKQRLHNYALAKEALNWEKESEKLLAVIH